MNRIIYNLLFGTVSATVLLENDFKFINYIAKHNKSYKSKEEYSHRKSQYDRIDSEIKHLMSF